MAYAWGEHVGELELRLRAPTERDVFADAVLALRELLSEEGGAPAGGQEREVRADGRDRAALLAGFLDELVFLAETEGFVPEALRRLDLGPQELRARVHGHRGDPPHLVKAVTHHRLTFDPSGEGFEATAVLDV